MGGKWKGQQQPDMGVPTGGHTVRWVLRQQPKQCGGLCANNKEQLDRERACTVGVLELVLLFIFSKNGPDPKTNTVTTAHMRYWPILVTEWAVVSRKSERKLR